MGRRSLKPNIVSYSPSAFTWHRPQRTAERVRPGSLGPIHAFAVSLSDIQKTGSAINAAGRGEQWQAIRKVRLRVQGQVCKPRPGLFVDCLQKRKHNAWLHAKLLAALRASLQQAQSLDLKGLGFREPTKTTLCEHRLSGSAPGSARCSSSSGFIIFSFEPRHSAD